MNNLKLRSVVIFLLFRAAVAFYDDYDLDPLLDRLDLLLSNKKSTEKPNNDQCKKCGIGFLQDPGTGGGRVLNGRPVVPEYKYPWIVPLIKRDHLIVCGGALISENFVLTAAHCVYRTELKNDPKCNGRTVQKTCYISPKELKVGLLGTNYFDPSKTLTVSKIIEHPLFSHSYKLNDIALLELEKPVRCSEKTRPVCLPTKDLTKLGQTLITAGWGYNTPDGRRGRLTLREGMMKEVKTNGCVKKYQPPSTNQTIVCAIAVKTQTACKGDSGTAIFGYFEKKFYAVGTASFKNSPKCNPEFPITFAKIYSFMTWIKIFVKNLPSP